MKFFLSMKNIIRLIPVLIIFLLINVCDVTAQNLDRLSLSSGGYSGDSMNVTLGEVFIFTLSGGNIALESGSQSSTGNTGTVTEAEISEDAVWGTLLLFPNPVSDFLNFSIDGFDDSFLYIQVFDMSGREVFAHNVVANTGLFTINISALPSGVYIFSGTTRQGLSVGKVKFTKV